MRILVRTVGLLLIALGTVLWARGGKSVPAQPSHNVASIAPSPPPVVHRHREPAAHPNVDTVPVLPPERTAPHSITTFSRQHNRYYEFEVHLYKTDGWFDTKIPITADVRLQTNCPMSWQQVSAAHWVEGRLGDLTIAPPREEQSSSLWIDTMLREDDPWQVAANTDARYIPLAETDTPTLNLRISPSTGPDDVAVTVSVFLQSQNRARLSELTTAQTREQEALKAWVGK